MFLFPNVTYRGDIGTTVRLRKKAVIWLVVHRTLSDPLEKMVAFYKNYPGTGHKFPYHYLIAPDGTVTLTVPLNRAAPGAVMLNDDGIQVALQGDFRTSAPTPAQMAQLKNLGYHLCKTYGKLTVVGHTELPGASDNPDHVCPGKLLDLKKFRSELDTALKAA